MATETTPLEALQATTPELEVYYANRPRAWRESNQLTAMADGVNVIVAALVVGTDTQ
jgi:hypothetical protein